MNAKNTDRPTMSSLRLFHGYLPTSFAKPEDMKDDYDQLRLRVSWILQASEDRLLLEPLQRQEKKITSEKKDSWTQCKKNQKTYIKSIRSSITNSSCSSISSCGGGECGCCGCNGCGGNGGDSIGGEGFRKDVKVSLY